MSRQKYIPKTHCDYCESDIIYAHSRGYRDVLCDDPDCWYSYLEDSWDKDYHEQYKETRK